MRARELFEKLNRDNTDGYRTLLESIPVPEVELALRDWIQNKFECVLIGGCAVDYYIRPRSTSDIDVLFSSDIPMTASNFKKTRQSAFQHNKTHVEVETVTPQHINVSPELSEKVFETANRIDGILVASPSALVALKLQRLKRNDIGDIIALNETGKVNLSDWPISEKNINDFNEIINKYGE